MTIDKDQYKVRQEPFYRAQGNEVTLYEAAYAARLPVMVKGPTGCGKSRFVEYMAWKLNKPLITVACNEDMTASDLVGRYLLDANGTRWLDGPLTTAARIGAICYLDEIVEARQDTTVVIHPLTDHRRTLPLDKKGELIEAHPDFQLVISYNPGYQSLMKDLKQSTKQRFTAFDFDYPEAALESEIIAKDAALRRRMPAAWQWCARLLTMWISAAPSITLSTRFSKPCRPKKTLAGHGHSKQPRRRSAPPRICSSAGAKRVGDP
ncbi:MAG: putative ATPase 5 [Proteobacteria bacterium]|nr:putative ATPase 5 [Pseudomonadota bacterium]